MYNGTRQRFLIANDVYLVADQGDYVLQKKIEEDVFSDIAYHRDLAAILQTYLEYAVRDALLNHADGNASDLVSVATVAKECAAKSAIRVARTIADAMHGDD